MFDEEEMEQCCFNGQRTPTVFNFLLKEDGDLLLLETGDNIILE